MKPEHKAVLQDFASKDHKGKPLDQKAMLKANPMIQKVLAARFISMPPEQQESIKGILTPQTEDALRTLLPELNEVITRGMKFIKRGMRNG